MANQRENDIVADENRDQDEIDYQKQVRFEGEAMNQNILSVSSDPPSLIRQRTCQVGRSNFFNNQGKPLKANASKESAQHGRWTEEEHQLFLEGLKLFNKDWRAIERYIGTRTCSQIRSHAQKFFMRLEKQQADGSQNNNSNVRDNASDGTFPAAPKFKKMQSTSTLLDPTHTNILSNNFFRDESKVDGSLESKD